MVGRANGKITKEQEKEKWNNGKLDYFGLHKGGRGTKRLGFRLLWLLCKMKGVGVLLFGNFGLRNYELFP